MLQNQQWDSKQEPRTATSDLTCKTTSLYHAVFWIELIWQWLRAEHVIFRWNLFSPKTIFNAETSDNQCLWLHSKNMRKADLPCWTGTQNVAADAMLRHCSMLKQQSLLNEFVTVCVVVKFNRNSLQRTNLRPLYTNSRTCVAPASKPFRSTVLKRSVVLLYTLFEWISQTLVLRHSSHVCCSSDNVCCHYLLSDNLDFQPSLLTPMILMFRPVKQIVSSLEWCIHKQFSSTNWLTRIQLMIHCLTSGAIGTRCQKLKCLSISNMI